MPRVRSVKNVALLIACQALGLTANTTLIATGALVGNTIAPDASLATLPQALFLAATTVGALPASWLMSRIGRRLGFATGALFGVAAGVTAAEAVIAGDFWTFVIGAVLFGLANSFVLYYRFAAGEVVEDAFRTRAISLVLVGGIAAAIMGPELSRFSKDLLEPFTFAATYMLIGLLPLVTMVMLAFVGFPAPVRDTGDGPKDTGRPLTEIATQPDFVVAVLAAVIGYAVMAFIMTATPLAVIACAHTFDDAAFIIEWHVLGMFVPSFFTGSLIAKFGVHRVMLAGCVLLGVTVGTNLTGVDVAHFWLALVALGVGWNFLFVGGTTLLTRVYRPEEKAKTQGLNEFLVFGVTAMASLSAGAVQNSFGWTMVNVVALPAIVAAFGAVVVLRKRSRLVH